MNPILRNHIGRLKAGTELFDNLAVRYNRMAAAIERKNLRRLMNG